MPPLINPNEILFNPESGYEKAPKGILDAMWQGTKQTVANIGDASGDFRNRPFSEAAMNAVIMNRPDFIDPSWRQTPDLLNPASARVDSIDPRTWVMPGDAVNNTSGNQYLGFPARDRRVEPGAQMHPSEAAAVSGGRDPGQLVPVAQQAVAGLQSTKPPVEPGVIAPDPGMDPAGNLAAKNANISAGAGNIHGQVKPAPDTSLADARAAIFKDLGQQVSFDNEELEPWYESPTFYRGLISFGLNLLSGNDLGASFNQAGQYYDQERGREKRGQWRDDLIEAGYNPTEIEAYIESGDNKLLTDPMERQKQLMDMEAGKLGLDKARWEASHRDEDRQREIDKEKREEARQARKDTLSEQLTLSSIAENEAQRKKALGLVATGGELGSGDLSQSPSKRTEAVEKNQYFWEQGRDGLMLYDQYKEAEGDDKTFFDDMVKRANISEYTVQNSNMDQLLSMVNPEDRARLTSQMAVALPILRKESGASIAASEYRTKLGILFGLRGESPEAQHIKDVNRVLGVERLNPNRSMKAKTAMANRANIRDAWIDDSTGSLILEYLNGTGDRFDL